MDTPLDPSLFAITDRVAYLNTARHGPLPRPAVAAVERWLAQAAAEVPVVATIGPRHYRRQLTQNFEQIWLAVSGSFVLHYKLLNLFYK